MRRVLFGVLGVVVLTAPHFSSAVMLKAVADVSIVDARVNSSDESYTVAVTAKNTGAQSITGVFTVRLQNDEGETVYSNTADEKTILSGATAEGTVPFVVPGVAGTYEVFAGFSSLQGVPLAVYGVDIINVKDKAAASQLVSYTADAVSCVYADAAVTCTSSVDAIVRAEYSIFAGGVSGKKVAEGSAVFDDGVATIKLSSHGIQSGRYGVAFVFYDADGSVVGTRELFFMLLESSWASIDIVSIDSTNDTFTARAFLAGSRANDEQWGLWYWVLDSQETICAHEKQRFDGTLPREYIISERLNDCVGAHVAVVLHLGIGVDNAPIVADTYGDADFDSLMRQTTYVPRIAQDIDARQTYVFWVLIVGVALIIVALLIVVGRRYVLVVAALLVLGTYAPFADAATFVSGNETFTVTLEKTTYQSNETVDFTFSIVDSTTGQKPVGDYVQVRVDSGSYTQIVSISDTATLYNVSLPAVTTGGAHNLNFIVPGHFFGFALFGSSRFGVDDREFSVSFSVTTNTAPPPPTISGSCVVGQTNTYYFAATDPNGDTIFYETYFNSESSNERLPGVGYVASGTQVSTTRAKATAGSEVVHVRATDVQGNVSSWNNQTIICVDACSHCVYNGGSLAATFKATPALVFAGDTATLSWELENVTNCSISSNHLSGDAWNWDTVRTVQSVSTSPISGSTIYTMQCDRVDGSPADPVSARVDLVPTFEEF